MNRKILALNLALLALLGSLGWMLRKHWQEARAQHLATLAKAARQTAQVAPPSPAPPESVVPANYLEVAQKTLFSKDRNPNVIIEAAPLPPPPPPPEPVPPRPEYFGQMGIGEPTAFLGFPNGVQKGFHAGDTVGPFKLVAFDRKTITFEWKDKTLEYPLAELKPKEPLVAVAAPPAARPAAAQPATALVGRSQDTGPTLGTQNGDLRACVPTDKSPSGTVKDGYKKTIISGPFGAVCTWEPIK